MIIIFDGPDLSGKTSLANGLADMMGVPVLKKRLDLLQDRDENFLKGDSIEFITEFFFESILPLSEFTTFILDRGLLSSLVYSKFFQRKLNTDYIYRALKDKNILTVYVDVSDETIESRYYSRGEKLFSLGELKTINTLYKQTFEVLQTTLTNHNLLRVFNNTNNESSLAQRIKDIRAHIYRLEMEKKGA